jgi:predicted nucleic acid-binding protein
MNVIPDTPVWSLVLRRNKPDRKIQDAFAQLIEEGRVILPGIIKQELLSGMRDVDQFELLNTRLAHFPGILAGDADHILAAKIFNKCQKSGIQGSHVDFLIVAIALNSQSTIMTTDKDFVNYRNVHKFELKFIS